MRLIHLPTIWTVGLDIAVWFVIHLGVAYWAMRLPVDSFDPEGNIFRIRNWEDDGKLYQRLFQIRRWKGYAPDGANLFGSSGFPKKRLSDSSTGHLHRFMLETCRAELAHSIMILAAPLFFFWNHSWVGVIMIMYAVAVNAPFIMIQRYNRFRLLRIVAKRRYNSKWAIDE